MPRYTEYRVFASIHSDTITRVAFNTDAKLFASASLDGSLFIWDVDSSSLCYHYFTGHPILSLVWADADRVLCGLKDGSIVCLVINWEKNTLDVTGIWGHSYPVEVLALSKNRLASGAHGELFIWRWNYNAVMSYQEREVTLPDPSEPDLEEDIVVTALHWSGNGDGLASLLIVGYMHHGIRIFETQRWGEVRHIVVDGLVGAAAVSPDNKYIAVSDVFTGFRVYSLESGESLLYFKQEIAEARPVPVIWLHGGCAILGGSTIESLSIQYVIAGHHVVRLSVPGSTKILAVAAHYHSDTNTFLIACGTETDERKFAAVIWRAKKRKGRQSEVVSDVEGEGQNSGDESADEEDEESAEPQTAALGGPFSSSYLLNMTIMMLGVVFALWLTGNDVLNFRGL